MIKIFIKEYCKINHMNKINLNMMIKSKKEEKLKYKNGNCNVTFTIKSGNRISIQDKIINNSSPKNKYIEKIRWGTKRNMAIAIGLNPSKCLPKNMDNTNKKVSAMLHSQGYDGYYLMNLYSYVQGNNFKGIGLKDQTKAVMKSIIKYIDTHKLRKIDIVFFFGCTFQLSKTMMSNLVEIEKWNASSKAKTSINYYSIGNKNNIHNHPSRVGFSKITFNYLGNSIPFIGYLK